MSTVSAAPAGSTARGKELGYQSFSIGKFRFERNEYLRTSNFRAAGT